MRNSVSRGELLSMTGKLSLNLTTLQPADFEQRLYAAGTAGFQAVGLVLDDFLKAGPAGQMELRLSQLAVSEVVGLPSWADPDPGGTAACPGAGRGRVPSGAGGARRSGRGRRAGGGAISSGSRRSVPQAVRVADGYLLRVGLEFDGTVEQVKDVATAWSIIEMAEENGGLVLDTFHYYRGDSTLDMLELVPGERIFLVQLADCLDLPKYELENRHRVYPGAGAMELEPTAGGLVREEISRVSE